MFALATESSRKTPWLSSTSAGPAVGGVLICRDESQNHVGVKRVEKEMFHAARLWSWLDSVMVGSLQWEAGARGEMSLFPLVSLKDIHLMRCPEHFHHSFLWAQVLHRCGVEINAVDVLTSLGIEARRGQHASSEISGTSMRLHQFLSGYRMPGKVFCTLPPLQNTVSSLMKRYVTQRGCF